MNPPLSLIGNGRMAHAIAVGLQDYYALEIIGRDLAKLEQFQSSLDQPCATRLLQEGVDLTDKDVILCIKPYALTELNHYDIKGTAHRLISVLAGVSLKTIKAEISAHHTLRAMPNVAAFCQESATALTGDDESKTFALELFSKLGAAIWVDSENHLDIATALAGSGPAYLALIAESLVDGAVKEGLPRDKAELFTQALFQGFGKLVQQDSPVTIKENVMSPGGTTAQGIAALEAHGVRHALMMAIEKAYLRAKSLA